MDEKLTHIIWPNLDCNKQIAFCNHQQDDGRNSCHFSELAAHLARVLDKTNQLSSYIAHSRIMINCVDRYLEMINGSIQCDEPSVKRALEMSTNNLIDEFSKDYPKHNQAFKQGRPDNGSDNNVSNLFSCAKTLSGTAELIYKNAKTIKNKSLHGIEITKVERLNSKAKDTLDNLCEQHDTISQWSDNIKFELFTNNSSYYELEGYLSVKISEFVKTQGVWRTNSVSSGHAQ